MITARSNFGWKRETISHFVKTVWKYIDLEEIFRKTEKRSKNWFLHTKYVTEATTPIFHEH